MATSAPIQAFLAFVLTVLHETYLQSHWLLSKLTFKETMDSDDKETISVAGTNINPWKEYWPSKGSNK